MTHKDYIIDISKNLIVQIACKDSEIPCGKFFYGTNNEDHITVNRTSTYHLSNANPNEYIFFDINASEFVKMDGNNIYSILYPNIKLLNCELEDIGDEVILNNNPGVLSANELTLGNLDKLKNDFKILSTFATNYTPASAIENLKTNQTLYVNKVFNDNQAKFNLIFNITPTQYLNNTYNLTASRDKYFEVLDKEAAIAVASLEEEKTKKIALDAREEIDSVIGLVNSGVTDVKNTCNTAVTNYNTGTLSLSEAMVDIFETWPPILYPVPTFICDNTDNDTTFQECQWKFTT